MSSNGFYLDVKIGPKGGFYGNKILYKNLDLTQEFPNKKISFIFYG